VRRPSIRILFAVALLGASGTAFAHPGHGVSGFAAGLAHPFSGLDHLLAMVAVGIWAVQGGGHRVWLLPATFMTMLVAGAALALQWQSLPMVEAGIAASVLALGLLVSLSLRLPAALSMGITAVFGFLHGYAHGLELPSSAHPVTYALGFLMATAFLHVSGVTLSRRFAVLAKGLGVGIAAIGGYMLLAS
jgi:urease accessory protein